MEDNIQKQLYFNLIKVTVFNKEVLVYTHIKQLTQYKDKFNIKVRVLIKKNLNTF